MPSLHKAQKMVGLIEATGTRLLFEDEIVEASGTVPSQCGIYFLIADDRVVYVGQSVNVFARVPNHTAVKKFDRVAFIPCAADALDVLETLYIHALRPPLNGRGRTGVPTSPLSLRDIRSVRDNRAALS